MKRHLIVSALVLSSSFCTYAATITERQASYIEILANVIGTSRVFDICEDYPSLKLKAGEVRAGYRKRNGPMLSDLLKAVMDASRKEEGDQKADGFMAYLDHLISSKTDEVDLAVRKFANSEANCRVVLDGVNKGEWDIRVRLSKAAAVVKNNEIAPFVAEHPQSSNFRGLAWGSTQVAVRRLLPDMKFDVSAPDDFLCRLMRKPGIECGAVLTTENYQIGKMYFSVQLYFTAYDKLAEVALTERSIGTAGSAMWRSYETMRAMLETKYGELANPNKGIMNNPGVSASCENGEAKDAWVSGNTSISLKGYFDTCSGGKSYSLRIIYQPTKKLPEKPIVGISKL